MNNDFIVLLVGPSASGKSTIADALERLYGWEQVRSITTRPRRSLFERGHLFFTDEEFDLIRTEEMVAYTEYAGYRYCAVADQIRNAQVYVIDIYGVHDFFNRYQGPKKVFVFFVDTPSSVIATRLKNRGVSQEEVERRLAFDKEAFSKKRVESISPVYITGGDLNTPEDSAKFVFSYVREHV